jgi:hypothetical protein
MSRTILTVVGLLALASLAVVAVTWEEMDWSAAVAPDPKTGTPALYFTVVIEYKPTPNTFALETSWVLFEELEGTEQVVDAYTKRSSVGGSIRRIYAMSSGIPVKPGGVYGAHLSLVDSVNGLRFSRDFRYVVPMVVPIGLRLEGWDGSAGVDLTGVADEELEQLATLYQHLRAYSKQEEGVSLEAFVGTSLPEEEAYPSVVLLVPTAGLSTTLSDGRQGVTLTVGQSLTMYVVPASSAASALLEQVSIYGKDFEGFVYRGSGDLGMTSGVRVFIDEMAWLVLEGAEAEWTRRSAS